MASQLTWSLFLVAAMAALACWTSDDSLGCVEERPTFGTGACCERHKASCPASVERAAIELGN